MIAAVSRAMRACAIGLWLFCVWSCSADSPREPGCAAAGCAEQASPTDWTRSEPLFAAHLRVIDTKGRALPGATVTLGGRTLNSDANGRVTFADLPAKRASVVRASAAGHAPYIAPTQALQSGQRTEDVTLVQLKARAPLAAQMKQSLQDDGVRIDLDSRSLARANGSRAAMANVEFAALSPSSLPASARVGGLSAVARSGRPTVVRAPLAVLYARFTDSEGTALNLAAGHVARVEFGLERTLSIADKARLPLYALDEGTGVWHEEGSCEVASVGPEAQKRKVCRGALTHFSYWAVSAEESASDSVACMRASARAEDGACFKVEVESMWLAACDADGGQCTSTHYASEALLSQPNGQPAYCGVLERAASQRVAVLYDVDASACQGELSGQSGRRIKLSEPVQLEATAGLAASMLFDRFASDALATCAASCRPVELVIGASDLASPLLHDGDEDGHYASEPPLAGPLNTLWADCDDGDDLAYAGAAELFCTDHDKNCDGVVGALDLRFDQVSDPVQWNESCAMCKEVSSIALGVEQPGNGYDEDCDGTVSDRDGDGFDSARDCDDLDPEVNLTKREIPGNGSDENCDGVAIDQDGDGMPSSQHLVFASELGLDPKLFVDCDDLAADVHPGQPATLERGLLASYYYQQSGQTRRSAALCSLFDSFGAPNELFHRVLRDLNCDGELSDLDGDGFAALGSRALGPAQALDCDDYDPRVVPNASGTAGCMSVDPATNDLQCSVSVGAPRCPAVSLTGVMLPTQCEEAKRSDGSGTGVGVCGYTGWWDGDPLSTVAGTLWGPCDGDGPLPDCPAQSQCGGPLPYSQRFTGYVQSTYTQGATLVFKGACFPICTL